MVNGFHKIAWIEGLSYLFLLLVAMPLKYIAGIPEFVKYGGWLHGVLFMVYVGMLAIILFSGTWSIRKCLWAGLLSLIPFGWKWIERVSDK